MRANWSDPIEGEGSLPDSDLHADTGRALVDAASPFFRRLRIYVAGPLSAGTTMGERANVEAACDVARDLLRQGWDPVVPHLNWHLATFDFTEGPENDPVQDYERWMEWCFATLTTVDAIYKIASSPGTERELAYNQTDMMSIPVLESLDEAENYLNFANQYVPEKWNVHFRRQANYLRRQPKT